MEVSSQAVEHVSLPLGRLEAGHVEPDGVLRAAGLVHHGLQRRATRVGRVYGWAGGWVGGD